MGFLGGVSLLLLSAVVIAFAIAVHKSQTVNRIYESHVKEWLEWSEFLVTWVDAMAYLSPMVMFKIVKKWNAVFFDCFTPLSIWLDSAYASCLLIQLVYFIGDYSKSYAKIAVEWMGLGVQMASIFTYVMLKSVLDESFPPQKADKQNIWALSFFGLSGFLLIMALDADGEIVAPAGQGYGIIAMLVAVLAMVIQIAQIFFAIYFRIEEENFNDDCSNVAMVKLIAAVVKVLAQSYYCWLYTAKGYWDSNEKKPLAIMTAFTVGCCVLVAFERYVGPTWLKSVYDTIVTKTRAGCHRLVAVKNQKLIEFEEWKTHTSMSMAQWWDEQRQFWSAEFPRRRTAVFRYCKSSFNRLMGRQVAAPPAGQVRGELPRLELPQVDL